MIMLTESYIIELVEVVWEERIWDSKLPDISHLNQKERQDFVRRWMNERHKGFKDEFIKKLKEPR